MSATTSTTYDAAGNVSSETDADGLVKTYTWSAQQKKLTETLGEETLAQTTTYTYDLADRLIKTTLPDEKEIVNTLDAAGRTTAVTAGGQTTEFEYDVNSRRTKTTSPLGIEVSNTYNALDKISSMTDGRGNTVNYTFNGYGEQINLKNRRNGNFASALNISERKSTLTTSTGKTTITNYATTL